MAAEIPKLELAQVGRLQQTCRRSGDEDLSAVGDRHEPRDAVDGTPEVVVVALLCRTGVQTHAYANLARFGRPGVCSKAALRIDRREQGIFRPFKCRADRVPDRLEDGPAAGRHDFPEQRVVGSQCFAHRIRATLPRARAALDVGEQKGYRPGR